MSYELRKYEREPNMRAPTALREVHALGKSPVITDQGRTIAESGVIIEHVVRE